MRFDSSALALGFVCILFSGCGSDGLGRQPISGTVNFDGAPIEKGTINFSPVDTAPTSTGGPIEAGKFSFDRTKGLPAGKYLVSIYAPKPGTGQAAPANTMPGDPLPVPQELIPAEWNTASTQTIEVQNTGKNEFNFEIKSKGK
jgi:hypothetical protein